MQFAEITLNGVTGAKLFSDYEIYEHQVIQVYFVNIFGLVVDTGHEPRCLRELCRCVVNHFVVLFQGCIRFCTSLKVLLGW